MPISSFILYPAMLDAVEQNPDLLDILVELSEDAGATPGAILPPDDPEYLASLNRVNQRMRDHLGWNEINDVDLEESMDSVSLSDFPTTTSQQMPVKPLQEAVKRRCGTTQFLFPDEISQRILALSQRIPDDVLAHSGRTADPHITVKYGLDVVDPDTIRQAIHNYGPVHVRLGKTSIFPAAESSGEYDVVKVDVDSDDLHGLNRVISDAIPHEDTYPDYQPHVTLGYVQPGSGELYAGWNDLEGTECTLNELMFADADKRSTAISLGEGRVHPTAKVDDAIATLDAALNGDVELTGEDLIELLDGLTPDEVAKVRAIYGLVESKGCQSCGREGIVEVPLDEELDEEELMEADGVTGAKVYKKGGPYKDKNGRIYCLNDQGRRTKCNQQQLDKAKEDFKQQGTSNPDESQKTEIAKQEKPEKPAKQSAEDVHNSIQSMLSEGINDDTVGKIVDSLKTLTVKDITAIKQKMGLKASGKKEELISKIAQRAVESVTKTTKQSSQESPVDPEVEKNLNTSPETPKEFSTDLPSSVKVQNTEAASTLIDALKKSNSEPPSLLMSDLRKAMQGFSKEDTDKMLWDLIDQNVLFPSRHNHAGLLSAEDRGKLLKNPNGKDEYVAVTVRPDVDLGEVSSKLSGDNSQPQKPEKPQPEPAEPTQDTGDIKSIQKDVLQKAKEAGEYIPVSIKQLKKNASPEQRKQIDQALFDMIDKGVVFPARHNHPGILPQEEKDLLLKNPDKNEYYVDIGYIPEDARSGYSLDGKYVTDEQFMNGGVEPQQEEKPAEPVEQPKADALPGTESPPETNDDQVDLPDDNQVNDALGKATSPQDHQDEQIVLDDDDQDKIDNQSDIGGLADYIKSEGGSDDIVIPDDDESIVLADDDDESINPDDDKSKSPKSETSPYRLPERDSRAINKKESELFEWWDEHPGLTESQEKSLKGYVSASGYRDINFVCRVLSGDPMIQNGASEIKKPKYKNIIDAYIRPLDELFDNTPKLPEPVTVWRGMQLKNQDELNMFMEKVASSQKQKGYVGVDSYTSTSIDPEVAYNFTNAYQKGIPVLMEIKASHGVYVNSALSGDEEVFDTEKELLLSRNTKFRIVGMEQDVDIPGQKNRKSLVLRLEQIMVIDPNDETSKKMNESILREDQEQCEQDRGNRFFSNRMNLVFQDDWEKRQRIDISDME